MKPFAPIVDLSALGDPGRWAELGEGNAADVFDIGVPGVVFKRYKPEAEPDPEGLDALIAWGRSLTGSDADLLAATTAWPFARVTSGGRTVGVLMPRLPGRFCATLSTGRTRPRTVQFLFYRERTTAAGVEIPSLGERIGLMSSAARTLDLFERHGIVYNDFSGTNISWATEPTLSMHFLDCDTASIGGRCGMRTHRRTPGWMDPYDGPGAEGRYGLALLAYRTLYVMSGAPKAAALWLPASWPEMPDVELLLAQGLGAGARPSPETWRTALEREGARSVAASGNAPTPAADHLPVPRTAPAVPTRRRRVRALADDTLVVVAAAAATVAGFALLRYLLAVTPIP